MRHCRSFDQLYDRSDTTGVGNTKEHLLVLLLVLLLSLMLLVVMKSKLVLKLMALNL